MERNVKRRKQRLKIPCFFLVVEGRSEKTYFANFSRRNCPVKSFVAPSGDPVGLVRQAMTLIEKGRVDLDDQDEMWCVFDRDNNSQDSIDDAVTIARKNGFNIAFSNPCFEIWLLWHFEDTFSCREISQNLVKELKPYLGEYCKTKDYFDSLSPNTNDAISRAKRAKEMLLQNGKKEFTREFNPSSNIYELIERMRSFQSVDRS